QEGQALEARVETGAAEHVHVHLLVARRDRRALRASPGGLGRLRQREVGRVRGEGDTLAGAVDRDVEGVAVRLRAGAVDGHARDPARGDVVDEAVGLAVRVTRD